VYAFGGCNFKFTIEIYNIANNAWTYGPEMPVGSCHLSTTPFGDKFYISGYDHLDVYSFDPATGLYCALNLNLPRTGDKRLVAGKSLYVLMNDKSLEIGEDGEVISEFAGYPIRFKNRGVGVHVASENAVYFGTYDCKVYRLDETTKEITEICDLQG
jgi:hypothetical protein